MTSIISGVAGLVLGFLAFVGAPLAIVTGVLALRQGFARGSNGKTFAIIGIVTGGLALIGIVVGLAYFYSRRAA